MHPRLGVTVVIQIVGDDGAAESCALSAAGLALMDAAVPMRGVLCAATVARTTTTSPRKREDAPLAGDEESGDCGRLIVDPTAGEERGRRRRVDRGVLLSRRTRRRAAARGASDGGGGGAARRVQEQR